MHKIDCMGYQNSSLVLEQALEDFVENHLSHMSIQGRDWIIKQ